MQASKCFVPSRRLIRRSLVPTILILVIVLILAALTGTGTAPAWGQESEVSGPPAWAVLDFENHSRYGGKELGRYASDAVILELDARGRYDILSRQETQSAREELGFTSVLSPVSERRLARRLGAAAVVTGEVTAISIPNKVMGRQGNAPGVLLWVTLTAQVRDARTGELIDGTRVTGVSESVQAAEGASKPLSLSDRVDEAMTNAAFLAAEHLSQSDLRRATVMMMEDSRTVLLSGGAQNGLTTGLPMVVTRFGVRVGMIKVTRVEADQADAVLTGQSGGLLPEDVATAVFTFPASSNHP